MKEIKKLVSWKNFFKPSWKNILLLIILFYWYTTISTACWINYTSGCSIGFPLSSTFPFFGVNLLTWVKAQPHVVLLDILFWYFISCSIIFVLSYLLNLIGKYKIFLLRFMSPTKWKILLSILGWISLGSIITHYLSGMYGGIGNFPSSLYAIYNFYEVVSIILLPFTLITLLLYYLTVSLWLLVLIILFLHVPSWGFAGFQPGYLTPAGAIFTVPLLILEWWVLSCFLVWIHDKVRKR